jgi:Flp pilus assembly pilin Flp
MKRTIHVAHRWRTFLSNESGAATAEYAIATMAAVAFAGLLVVIMRSEEVRQILLNLIRDALTPDLKP